MPMPHLERHWRAVGLSIVLASLLYLGGAIYSGWQDVWSAIIRIGVGGLFFVLMLSLSNYGFRFIRWGRYLAALGWRIPWRVSLGIYLAGFALTTTPGKSGELVRSLLLKRQGMGYAASVAAFVAERASDLMALLALLAMVSLSGLTHPKAWIVSLIIAMMTAMLIFIMGHPKFIEAIHNWIEPMGWKLLARLSYAGVKITNHFSLCVRGETMWLGLGLGILAWGAEGSGFYLICSLASATGPTWDQAIFIYAFATLVGALTLMPGGLGSTEAVMLSLLMVSGVGYGEAIAIIVVARVATLWFGVSIGAGALALSYREQSVTTKQLPQKTNR